LSVAESGIDDDDYRAEIDEHRGRLIDTLLRSPA